MLDAGRTPEAERTLPKSELAHLGHGFHFEPPVRMGEPKQKGKPAAGAEAQPQRLETAGYPAPSLPIGLLSNAPCQARHCLRVVFRARPEPFVGAGNSPKTGNTVDTRISNGAGRRTHTAQ